MGQKYAAYNAQGAITAFYDSVDSPAPEGVSVIEITDAQWQAAIGGGYTVQGGALVEPTPPTTAEIKAAKWDAIKAERDRRTEQGGYKVGTKWFHSDQKSRGQQLGLVLLGASIPANLQWKTMDGSFVTMTQQLAGQVLAAAAASDQAMFAAAEAHKVAMEASADPASYDYSGGWPKIYGE